jgi:hypothetical protein
LIQQNAAYAQYVRISAAIGLIVSIVLTAAGVGLLLLKPWGRVLSIGYAIYGIISPIIMTAINVYFMLPMLQKASNMPMGPQRMAITSGIVGGVIGGCFGMIFPIALLYFMYRPNVIAAFSSNPHDVPNEEPLYPKSFR